MVRGGKIDIRLNLLIEGDVDVAVGSAMKVRARDICERRALLLGVDDINSRGHRLDGWRQVCHDGWLMMGAPGQLERSRGDKEWHRGASMGGRRQRYAVPRIYS